MIRRVAALRSDYASADQSLEPAINLLGPAQPISHSSVAVTINSCRARAPETRAVTHPMLPDALLHRLREDYGGVRILVVESDAAAIRADMLLKCLRYLPILERGTQAG